MDNSYIAERIAQLRTQKNISAREMSLAIGQNESYINRIENHKALPSMQCFLYICEYLNVTPKEFFDKDTPNPNKLASLIIELQKLNTHQLDILSELIKEMI